MQKEIISNMVKDMFRQFPICEITSDDGVRLSFRYNLREKIEEKLGRYYFGVELKYETKEEFQHTLKELLRAKRALIEIEKERRQHQ